MKEEFPDETDEALRKILNKIYARAT